MNTRFLKGGFSIVELVVALAVIAAVVGLISFAFSKTGKTQSVDNAAGIVLSQLEQARSLTLASKNASQYGVYFASSTAVLFKGPTYAASLQNSTATLPANTEISNLNLTGGATSVVFQRLTGETVQSGTIKISTLSQPVSSSTITLYSTGIAEAN